jgi:hypothetical protein
MWLSVKFMITSLPRFVSAYLDLFQMYLYAYAINRLLTAGNQLTGDDIIAEVT